MCLKLRKQEEGANNFGEVFMTTIETQFESHLQSQLNRAIITGNWGQIRYLLQRPGVNASVTQEVFTDLADEITDAFAVNKVLQKLLRGPVLLTLGEFIRLLDAVNPESLNPGQLSRKKINELSKVMNITPLAVRLQQRLTESNTNVINITAKKSPEVYITKTLKPIQDLYELYQWANIQDPKYYDTVLNVDNMFEILGDKESDHTTVLNDMLESEYEQQLKETDHSCE